MKKFETMPRRRLDELLDGFDGAAIGFVGDICVDIYWEADMRRSELSRETPHFPLPIVSERVQLGAGGNVLADIAALKPRKILAVGALGGDWRGMLALRELERLGIDERYIVRRPDASTAAYCKPIRKGISDVVYEDPRLDFSASPIDGTTEKTILENIDAMAAEADVICVSDQFCGGVITPAVRRKLTELGGRMPVIADSRDRIAQYKGVIVKPNETEAAGAVGAGMDCGETAKALRDLLGGSVVLTLGKDGSAVCDENGCVKIDPMPAEPPLDICGAGDCYLACLAAALASGARLDEAAYIGGLGSTVVIKKLGMTGSACAREIRAVHGEN